jgi:polar amino acid transport system permease protein
LTELLDVAYILKITPFILKGSGLTLSLYGVTILLAIPFGFSLALLKVSKFAFLRNLVALYTWVIRGTPLLLQLFFVYYGLPLLGLPSLSPFAAAVITFVVNYAAYLTEIYRAGIESIDRGQYEAAHALNLSYVKTMRRIILPQVIRRTLPPICNEAITLVKDTALVAVIGMGDLLRSSKEIMTRDFRITAFVIAALVYLLMSSVIVMVFRRLETRYSAYEQR